MYSKFLKLLEERHVTAYKVGKDTGIASATLSDWKNGKSTPKKEKMQKIADYFNVPLSYFYGVETTELTPQENNILRLYNALNEEGREMLLDYAEFLQKKYAECNPHRMVESA